MAALFMVHVSMACGQAKRDFGVTSMDQLGERMLRTPARSGLPGRTWVRNLSPMRSSPATWTRPAQVRPGRPDLERRRQLASME